MGQQKYNRQINRDDYFKCQYMARVDLGLLKNLKLRS